METEEWDTWEKRIWTGVEGRFSVCCVVGCSDTMVSLVIDACMRWDRRTERRASFTLDLRYTVSQPVSQFTLQRL